MRLASLRRVGTWLLGLSIVSALGGCVVYDERRCPGGWVPPHTDRWGRWHRGHCR